MNVGIAFAIEAAVTGFATAAGISCMAPLYKQYKRTHQKEKLYRNKLVQRIQAASPLLPNKQFILSFLERALEVYSTPEQRIAILRYYSHNPKALRHLLSLLRQNHASKEVMHDLGLHWQP